MTALITTLIIAAALGIGGLMGWSNLSNEHEEARNVSLDAADFGSLNDGTYEGEYDGGMYGWRAGKVSVVVASGRVEKIVLLVTSDPGAENTDHERLFNRVVEAQSLDVDVITGATLTSKAWLKAVENALVKADKKREREKL